MACALEQINQLQIREEYKQGLVQFCQDPNNAQACAELCAAGPEAITEAFTEAEVTMQQMAQEGIPEELVGGLSQGIPEIAQTPTQDAGVQGFAHGGLASLGRYGDDQIAHVQTGEVVVPLKVLRSNPQLAQGITRALEAEGVNPERFQVGGVGSYNPQTGMQEFGFFDSLKKIAKKIAPIALAIVAPTMGPALFSGTAAAGWSAATWSAVGAGVGTKLAGGSWKDSVVAGGLAYGTSALLSPASTSSNPSFNASPSEVPVVKGGQSAPGPAAPAAQNQMTAPTTPEVSIAPQTGASGKLPQELMITPTPSTPPPPPKTAFMNDPMGWVGENKGLAALGAAALFSGTEAEMPQRPEGYNMQTDPDQQYGGRPYETRGNKLMAGLDDPNFGIAPMQSVAPQSGYSYGMGNLPQYGTLMTPEEQQARADAYAAAIQGYSAPTYAQLNAANGGYIAGAGTETSDSIPANLSNGEFVMTAQAVRGAGKGSVREGARRMYQMMDELERRA